MSSNLVSTLPFVNNTKDIGSVIDYDVFQLQVCAKELASCKTGFDDVWKALTDFWANDREPDSYNSIREQHMICA